ncbi:hypothetical protein Q3G72_009931 [Acer saccharum]|nr:hypothetical protein Q3G72_009931 [Acer saccharum]
MAMEAASFNWENPTKKELWGNIKGGHPWNYQPNGAITHIKIRWGSNIDAISFKSTDGNGNWTQFGGSTGREEPPFEIGWPNDYLESITGSYDSIAINTLCFKTHRGKQYGPFGTPNDGEKKINISTKDSTIVGFFGREGALLDALGIYVKPFAEVSPVPLPDLPTPEPLPLVPSPVLPMRQERDIQPAQVFMDADGKSHTWEIKKFMERGHEEVRFNAKDRTWELHMDRTGKHSPNGEFMSLYMKSHELDTNHDHDLNTQIAINGCDQVKKSGKTESAA